MKDSTLESEYIIKGVIKGDKILIAKALNLLENNKAGSQALVEGLIRALFKHVRHDRHIIGITGPPGVGKSSLISDLLKVFRERNKTVGLIVVDPSSKRSGGALLGDRYRIRCDPSDEGVFIRSMAARGHLGGLSLNTRYCVAVFEVAYDYVIIETVGVGQSETEIDQVADTVIFMVQPGSGDSLQFMKSGIIEIPHLLVINKADRKGPALKVQTDLQAAPAYGATDALGWSPGIIKTSAREHWGASDVIDWLEKHYRHLIETRNLESIRRERQYEWIYMIFKERFGLFGLECLGGSKKVRGKIRDMAFADPFEGIQRLESEFLEKSMPD